MLRPYRRERKRSMLSFVVGAKHAGRDVIQSDEHPYRALRPYDTTPGIAQRSGDKQLSPDRCVELNEKVSWQRPTLPGSRPPSTIGADGLNDQVRDVTGCTTVAQVTKRLYLHLLRGTLCHRHKSLCMTQWVRVRTPERGYNSPHHAGSLRSLVRVSCMHCCTSTPRLSSR